MFKFIKFLYKFSDTGFTNTVTVKVVHVIDKKKGNHFSPLLGQGWWLLFNANSKRFERISVEVEVLIIRQTQTK